ncbi:hypothetical protein Q8F55_006067 [Vanrija albida]|uniref:Uncharacterized protein n=1 Tax=Vanrija albida TaxID=181172 RepID=A0ABR3Q3D6_9TREE
MLLRTIVALSLAALVSATPLPLAVRADPVDLPTPNPGISIRCFDSLDCTGRELASSGDFYDTVSGLGVGLFFDHAHDALASCRFDAWDGFEGRFHFVGFPQAANGTDKNSDWHRPPISEVVVSYGPGEFCVNQLEESLEGECESIDLKFAIARRL